VHLPSFIDGGPFDILTLVVAVAVALGKCWRHGHSVISVNMGFNVIHGLAIFPLLMLSLSAISREALDSVLASNRLILSVAGLIALLAILEKEFSKADPLN
jgi:multisubunit Na+/H+ antiporter MnhF subunit